MRFTKKHRAFLVKLQMQMTFREGFLVLASQIIVMLQSRHLFSTSTIELNTYIDDPQNVSNALTKEKHTLWDDEW